MKTDLVNKINQSTAHRKSRVYLSNYIIRHEELLNEFISIHNPTSATFATRK